MKTRSRSFFSIDTILRMRFGLPTWMDLLFMACIGMAFGLGWNLTKALRYWTLGLGVLVCGIEGMREVDGGTCNE